jgi:hypothetical protein
MSVAKGERRNMQGRTAKLLPFLVAGAIVALAGCKQDEPAPAPVASESQGAVEPEPTVAPSADASGAAGNGIAAELDLGALQEKRDPERLLRFYTNAIRIGDWEAAARAWSLDAQMTPEKLQAEFSGDAGPKVAVGKGDWENAAGSVFYEAPLTITFADARESRRGSIVLHRANDVPGASELQLVWRIERSSTVPQ